MENERFTFIVIAPEHHFTQDVFLTRARADKHFDDLIEAHPEADCIAYYCASVGGQVNCYKVS
jgi:hypothetical protein